MAPVVFGLRMHVRVSIDLRGRGLQDLRLNALGEAEHVDRAVHARLRRLHRVVLVMNGRRRAGKIIDLVDLEVDWERDVVTDELEALFADEVLDVAPRPGKEIVDADNFRALRQQTVAQMRAEEPGAAGHHDALLQMHDLKCP